MIAFFETVRSASQSRNVFVDLSNVTLLTPDAIAALLATIHLCRLNGGSLSGNVPSDRAAQQVLNESGFRTYVRSSPTYQRLAPKGKIAKRTLSGETYQNRFDQELARDLIEFATSNLGGGKTGPSYSVFSEAMLNTLNHASGFGRSHEPWWASAYFDSIRNRVCFTFIDQGVGIFKSHRWTATAYALKHLRFFNAAQILELIFQGKIPSTTKIAGRGNGIPGMYDHCKAGRIKNFMVISNTAVGNAETEVYEMLSNAFPGTLLYWEIGT